jgi:hypothetical protein
MKGEQRCQARQNGWNYLHGKKSFSRLMKRSLIDFIRRSCVAPSVEGVFSMFLKRNHHLNDVGEILRKFVVWRSALTVEEIPRLCGVKPSRGRASCRGGNVVPQLRFGQAAKSCGCRKPLKLFKTERSGRQPSHSQQRNEREHPNVLWGVEPRTPRILSVWKVNNEKQSVQKLSGAVQPRKLTSSIYQTLQLLPNGPFSWRRSLAGSHPRLMTTDLPSLQFTGVFW